MGTSAPWNITAKADGKESSHYNDNLCVYCTSEYQSLTSDNFGVSTIDCTSTLFVANDAGANSIKKEYKKGHFKNFEAESFFKNDKTDQCPIKTCSLWEKGCTKELDNENFAISDKNLIVVKLSDSEGYDIDACVKCSNGQQNITYDKWSIS